MSALRQADTTASCHLHGVRLSGTADANGNTNTNTNVNRNMGGAGREKNKWVAFTLCLLLGWLGAHKFYEGKALMGILYLLTVGVFGFGWLLDTILLLFKPNPYYV